MPKKANECIKTEIAGINLEISPSHAWMGEFRFQSCYVLVKFKPVMGLHNSNLTQRSLYSVLLYIRYDQFSQKGLTRGLTKINLLYTITYLIFSQITYLLAM